MKKLIFFLICLSVISCKENNTEKRIPVEPNNGIGDGAEPPKVFSFSENMEEAHNKTAFMMKEAVAFDIQLEFGGNLRLDGKVSMTTTSSKVKLEKADGTSIFYDGNDVRISPENAEKSGARFDIFTWQYFFAMPFKLTDPGTVWEEEQNRKLDDSEYNSAKLSFRSNTGDSPEDWYIVYQDSVTKRLKAAAYIVTFSKEKEEAEKEPHAITYNEYELIDQIAMATKWKFYNWSEEKGLMEQLGEATISNIRFFKPEDDYFEPKNGSAVIER